MSSVPITFPFKVGLIYEKIDTDQLTDTQERRFYVVIIFSLFCTTRDYGRFQSSDQWHVIPL